MKFETKYSNFQPQNQHEDFVCKKVAIFVAAKLELIMQNIGSLPNDKSSKISSDIVHQLVGSGVENGGRLQLTEWPFVVKSDLTSPC